MSRAAVQKAINETKNKPKVGVFRGVKLTLPAVLPASFAFDAMEIEVAGGMQLADIRRVVVSLAGEDGWRQVREKVAADGDPMDAIGDLMTELLTAIFEPFGVSLGESPASAVS